MNKLIRAIFFSLILAMAASAQTFSDFLTRVNSSPADQRQAIVDSMMEAIPAFPFIEDSTARFIWQGTANTVQIAGDHTGWSPDGNNFWRVSNTDFWYRSTPFEMDARLDYKYVINGSSWVLDSLNPNTVSGGFGPNSELSMPDYIPGPEIEFYADIDHGTLTDSIFTSDIMGNSRRIRIYLPHGYEESAISYPTVLFHDGLEMVSLGKANNVLDYLIYHNRIEPVIAVFVPPVNRSPEYAGNLQIDFTSFIINELYPWIDNDYRTIEDPASRATFGASNGGNIALHLGTDRPDFFGSVGAYSPNVQTHIYDILENDPMLDLEFYVDIGTYDIDVLMPLTANLVSILETREYACESYIWHEGHSWGNWRAHLDIALEQFFPGAALDIPDRSELPKQFELKQNFPNPFNSSTTIAFTLPHSQHVRLDVYDLLGRNLETLIDGNVMAGESRLVFDASSIATGNYFIHLDTKEFQATEMMTYVK